MMRIKKTDSPAYKEQQRKIRELANDRRVMQYMKDREDEGKLEMFETTMSENPLSEEDRGPNSFHEFHPEDQDDYQELKKGKYTVEEKISSDMQKHVIDAIVAMRKAPTTEVVTILNEALLKATKSQEATQLFMAAFKRIRELFWNQQIEGIREAVYQINDALNSKHIEALYMNSDSEQTRVGILGLVRDLQNTKKPALKGKDQNGIALKKPKNKKRIYDASTQATLPEWEGEGPDPVATKALVPKLSFNSEASHIPSPKLEPQSTSDSEYESDTSNKHNNKRVKVKDDDLHFARKLHDEMNVAARPQRERKQREILTVSKLGGKATDPYESKTIGPDSERKSHKPRNDL